MGDRLFGRLFEIVPGGSSERGCVYGCASFPFCSVQSESVPSTMALMSVVTIPTYLVTTTITPLRQGMLDVFLDTLSMSLKDEGKPNYMGCNGRECFVAPL